MRKGEERNQITITNERKKKGREERILSKRRIATAACSKKKKSVGMGKQQGDCGKEEKRRMLYSIKEKGCKGKRSSLVTLMNQGNPRGSGKKDLEPFFLTDTPGKNLGPRGDVRSLGFQPFLCKNCLF